MLNIKNENENTLGRNIGCDILRAWAMIMVFVCHLSQRIFLPGNGRISYAEGSNGVWILFVLSGFFGIASFERCMKNDDLSSSALLYYINRLVRIIPLYWVAIIFSITIHHFYLLDVPQDTYKLNLPHLFSLYHLML